MYISIDLLSKKETATQEESCMTASNSRPTFKRDENEGWPLPNLKISNKLLIPSPIILTIENSHYQ